MSLRTASLYVWVCEYVCVPYIQTLKKIYEFIKIPANAEVCECLETFMKSVDITGARRPLSPGLRSHSGLIRNVTSHENILYP